jgi:hypothetical protein
MAESINIDTGSALSRYSAIYRKIENAVEALRKISPSQAMSDEIVNLKDASTKLQLLEQEELEEPEILDRGRPIRPSRYDSYRTVSAVRGDDTSPTESTSTPASGPAYDISSDGVWHRREPAGRTPPQSPRRYPPVRIPAPAPEYEYRYTERFRSPSRVRRKPRRKLKCGVDRASIDVDMSHPDWRTFHDTHIIVTYHRDLPPQTPTNDRADGGENRLKRRPTFIRAAQQPLRIRINSTDLMMELENILSGSFGVIPAV